LSYPVFSINAHFERIQTLKVLRLCSDPFFAPFPINTSLVLDMTAISAFAHVRSTLIVVKLGGATPYEAKPKKKSA